MRDYLNASAPTHFLFPIDGDHLNARDGVMTGEELTVTVKVHAAPDCKVAVNGIAAIEKNGAYEAELALKEGENTLFAENSTDGTNATVRVYFSNRTLLKYRISSDDNILFLADITKNKDTYTSIFDNPDLAVYKKAHDLYGAKVHLNLFYAFDREAAKCFSADRPDFDLSMMTDKFKAEWEANADWLELSFHAHAEFPGNPYVHATPEKITEDFLAVKREVIRFAGEKAFTSETTTTHWGSGNKECCLALRALGHRVLTGYLTLSKNGNPSVSYYLPASIVGHADERDFWTDHETGLHFGRIDRVTNIGTLEEVMADMQAIIDHPHRGGFVSFMIHEQYFYEDYKNHLPDFEARVLQPAKLLVENGYTGAQMTEVI